MTQEEVYSEQCKQAIRRGEVKATMYRHGAVVTGWPSRFPSFSGGKRNPRGIITQMSIRSRIRAAFAIANSPIDFELMTVLTFREKHSDPKECMRRWALDATLNSHPSLPWGWATEFQKRGVVHYHIIHTSEQLTRDWGSYRVEYQEVRRKGQARLILQGPLGRLLQNMWIARAGDTSSEFLRFQRGGITELMEKPELTARYLGGYLSKSAQKVLPDVESPQGRWWWLSKGARPIAGATLRVDRWPLERPHRLLHDHKKLEGCTGPEVAPGPQNLHHDFDPPLSRTGLTLRRVTS